MGTFEGYVGIRLWDGQLVDDVVFSLLFVLFMCFALVFRTNYRLFLKMMRDVVYVKERQNLFEVTRGSEWLFRNFMTFQALFLCSVCLFAIARAVFQPFARKYGIDIYWVDNDGIDTVLLV